MTRYRIWIWNDYDRAWILVHEERENDFASIAEAQRAIDDIRESPDERYNIREA